MTYGASSHEAGRRIFVKLLKLMTLIMVLLLVSMPSHASLSRDDQLREVQRVIAEKGANWTAGSNEIWELPREERLALLGWNKELDEAARASMPEATERAAMLRDQFDWRDVDGESYITPITNQEQCGSCWAFGAVACMEARFAIDGFIPFPTLDLSEQYLLSCSPGTCNGYALSGTCDFLRHTGTPTEACMPYHADDTIPCDNHCSFSDMELLTIQNWGWIASNQAAIKTRILDGPVYVAFTVYEDFMAYTGGIYEHLWGEVEAGHAVALVGWNDEQSYWILKNSWGPEWGENGYFRMKYGQCGMEGAACWLTVNTPTFPNLCVADVIMTEVEGDGDGVVNPGERASLGFLIENSIYWISAQGIDLTLSVAPEYQDRVSVIQGTDSFDVTVLPGDSAWCMGDFIIQIADIGPVDEIPLQVTMESNVGGSYPYEKTSVVAINPSISMPGWPFDQPTDFYAGPACFSLGDSMVVAVADRYGDLWVLDGKSSPLPGWPVSLGDVVRSAPAVADLDGDGSPEIVVGTRNDLFAAFHVDGTPLLIEDIGNSIAATVLLADLTGNGFPDMVAGDIQGNLWALDSQGNDLTGWPVDFGQAIISGAALVQDHDPLLICAGSRSGMLHLLDPEAQEMPGWPVDVGGEIWTGPVVADYDDDGDTEIICAAGRSVYAIELSGSATELFSSTALIRSALLVLDIDGDRKLEAIFATSAGRLYVVKPDGELAYGWPRSLENASFVGLTAADIDNDGLPELICSTDRGIVSFLDGNGSLLNPSPVYLDGGCLSPPSLADMDGDGDLEIIIGTDQGVEALDLKCVDARAIWATHRADLRRTGYYVRDTAMSPPQKEVGKPLIRLLTCSPIPARDELFLTLSVPRAEPVSIYLVDLAGRSRIATVLHPNPGITRNTISLRTVPSGVYLLTVNSSSGMTTNPILHLR